MPGTAVLLPVRHRGVRRRVVPAQVDPDDGVPLLRRHLQHGPVAQHAGVVDQAVEPAELGHRGRDQPVGHLDVGDVALDEHRRAAGSGDLADHPGADVRVELVEHDRRSLPRALQRLPAAEPAPGAGDHDHLVVQQTHAGEPTRVRNPEAARDRP